MGLIKDKEFLINELKLMGIKDEKVINAIHETKRECFVPNDLKEDSYKNYPLSIGHGQTISQPYTVAFMIELLNIKQGNKILEIGAGSGYNAAVMSYLVGKEGKIYAIELIKELTDFAKDNLKRAGINNVEIIHGDGYHGYKKASPYDRIIITAGTPKIPDNLIKQLKNKGIIVAPVKKIYGEEMVKIVKINGKLEKTTHGSFAFVPLRGHIER